MPSEKFIAATAISFSFPERFHPLITDATVQLSLSSSPPARVGLIGPNGHGKTTLLRLLLGELQPESGRITRPSDGVEIAYLPQALLESSTRMALRDFIAAPLSGLRAWARSLSTMETEMGGVEGDALDALLERYGELQARFEAHDGYTLDSRVERVMQGLGLAQIPPGTRLEALSMGQRTRAALARVLLTPAELMILDEPTNHLDDAALEWLEALLEEVNAAVLVVSHDRAFLDRVTRETWSLERSVLETYAGPYSAYRQFCEAREARLLHEEAVVRREIRRLESALEQRATWSSRRERDKFGEGSVDRGFIGACAARHMKRAKAIEGRISRALDEKREALPRRARQVRMRFEAMSSAPRHMLTLRDVRVCRGGRCLFEGLEVDLEPGSRLAIVGPNGSGKSTLLHLIAGTLSPERGARWIAPRTALYHFTQNHDELTSGGGQRRVIDAVIMRAASDAPSRASPDALRAGSWGEARTMLGCLGFTKDDVLQPLGTLSQGQLSRVALARALLSGANLLLLDEPTNHLDPRAREALEEGLSEFRGAVVYASHDRRFIEQVGGRVLRLSSNPDAARA